MTCQPRATSTSRGTCSICLQYKAMTKARDLGVKTSMSSQLGLRSKLGRIRPLDEEQHTIPSDGLDHGQIAALVVKL
jgi:hypothetical protein